MEFMEMLGLVPFLHANGVDFSDDNTKVHLAGWNGSEHPIDEFYAGTFNAWQEHQTKRNFECKFVLSLIDLGNREWLFAGVYEVVGSKSHPKISEHTLYSLRLLKHQADLIGRIIVSHSRTRQSYIWWKADIVLPIVEIRREPMTIAEFPGYNAVVISHQTLQTIVHQQIPSWHKPLEHIKGIYLITDMSTGKHYVGKASGSVGIWQRWCSYATNGHGGNVELKRLINEHGSEYAHHFQYSILEIADTHASEFDILKRESYWMDALQTRRFGLNGSKRS
jgi:hypothetical protein